MVRQASVPFGRLWPVFAQLWPAFLFGGPTASTKGHLGVSILGSKSGRRMPNGHILPFIRVYLTAALNS